MKLMNLSLPFCLSILKQLTIPVSKSNINMLIKDNWIIMVLRILDNLQGNANFIMIIGLMIIKEFIK